MHERCGFAGFSVVPLAIQTALKALWKRTRSNSRAVFILPLLSISLSSIVSSTASVFSPAHNNHSQQPSMQVLQLIQKRGAVSAVLRGRSCSAAPQAVSHAKSSATTRRTRSSVVCFDTPPEQQAMLQTASATAGLDMHAAGVGDSMHGQQAPATGVCVLRHYAVRCC